MQCQLKKHASEPEILLGIMDRFKKTWAVIIALVGGGQEINTGEGGLNEWGKAINDKFSHWKVHISPELRIENNFTGNMAFLNETNSNVQIIENPDLHLKVSIRSFKAQELSEWVNSVLSDMNKEAKEVFQDKLKHYPIFITRSLSIAKKYLKQKARGSRRIGLVASSGAKRLRAIGIDINAGLKGTSHQNELGAWYLNPTDDVRSSNFLEVIGSEFGVQGLELDWTCVCWDADLRRRQNGWDFRNFSGTKWTKVNSVMDQKFVLNSYRVLLTRAREGMIIFVPEGDEKDVTRLPEFYDPIYEYLKSCGLVDL